MALKQDYHDDVLVLAPGEARLDAQAAIAFKQDFIGAIAEHEGPVGLDLGGVTFMDSSGLGAIVACFKGLGRGRALVVFNAKPAVRKVFEITRIDRVLPMVASLDEALLRCRS
jgi:anti-sigma B factor antagonist